MNPQGTVVFNASYIASLTAAINAASSCAALQALVTQALTSLQAEGAAIEAEIAKLAPQLALLTAPTSPGAAVTWIQNFISTYLTPQLTASATYTAKAAALVAAYAALTAAIVAKAATFTSCSITVPSLPAPL